MVQHPEVAFRDCDHCMAYLYDLDTGQLERDGRTQEPVPRPQHKPPACHLERGCPKGCYRHPKKDDTDNSLTLYNRRAYEHYLECKATGDWPCGDDGSTDSTVKSNAAIISEALRVTEWTQRQRLIIETESANKNMLMVVQASLSR